MKKREELVPFTFSLVLVLFHTQHRWHLVITRWWFPTDPISDGLTLTDVVTGWLVIDFLISIIVVSFSGACRSNAKNTPLHTLF